MPSSSAAPARTTPLESVAQLKQHNRALQALGYRTLETFLGASRVAAKDLSKYLGTDVNKLIETLPGQLRESLKYAALPPRFPLGAHLEGIPPVPPRAYAFSLSGAPTNKVNWIPEMPPIRNQGSRGTCVAHASLAVVEHYATVESRYLDMSEQFLYWDCKQNDAIPTVDGTWVDIAMKVLERDGCCTEAKWPYQPMPVPGNVSQNPPPSGAQAEALGYRVTPYHQMAPTSIADIKNELARRRCVAFSIPVFNSWYQNSEVTRTGDIVVPIPDEQNVGGHAMCLVGFEDFPAEGDIGGGRFLLRNSWGAAWGTESVNGPGYGTIPYAYLARHGMEAYSIN